MPAASLFRELSMPSHRQDHAAHERFLLDTYAERKAPASRRPAWLAALIARVK